MWKLQIDTHEGETRWLDLRGPEVTIGRGESCALRLDERNVSRRHARLRRGEGGGWLLADGGSRNGTFVNGRAARGEVPLAPGDLVQIGDFTLTLCDAAALAAGAPAPRRPPRAQPRLLIVDEGEGPVTDLPLAQSQITIGGREGCTFQASGPALDATLVRVRALDDGRYEVRDESARPSLLVNGDALACKALEEGDLLCLGEITQTRRDARYGLVLRYLGGPAAPARAAAPPPEPARPETPAATPRGATPIATPAPRPPDAAGGPPSPRPAPAARAERGPSAPSLAGGAAAGGRTPSAPDAASARAPSAPDVASARAPSAPNAAPAPGLRPMAPEPMPPESVRAGRAPRPSAPEYVPGAVGASVLERALTLSPDAPITGAPMTVDAFFARSGGPPAALSEASPPLRPSAHPRRRRGLWAGALLACLGASVGLWASRGARLPGPPAAGDATRALDVPVPPAPEPPPAAEAPAPPRTAGPPAAPVARPAASPRAPRPSPPRSAVSGQLPAAVRSARCLALRERMASGEATAYERSLFQTQCP